VATLNIENASQVEILKGPFSSFFGSDAMSGIINIVGKRSKGKIGGGASVTYGSFSRYKISANIGGSMTSKLNFDFYANTHAQKENYKTGNNNLLSLTDNEKLIMEEKSYGKEYKNTQYEQYSVGGRLGYQITKNWELHLNQDYWAAKDVQSNGTFWGSYGELGKDINRWSQSLSLEGQLTNHRFRFSPHYSIENNDFHSDLSENSFKTDNNQLKMYGFILQDAVFLGTHRLIFGIDHLSKKFESKRWESAENSAGPYQPDYLNSSTGTYLQADFSFLEDNLNASIGLRYDNIVFKLFETELIESINATENYNELNPNLGIQYRFLNGFKIHGAAGRAFTAPDAFKVAGDYTTEGFYATNYKGNPDLKPESSVTYDLGISYTCRKLGIDADITYFNTDFKDKVEFDFSNMEYVTFINASKAKMNGLELEFAYDFGALSNYAYNLKLYLDYTHLYNANVIMDEEEGTTEEQLKYVRMNKAAFGIMFNNKKGLAARINARYIGERDEDNWLYNTDWTTWERIPYLTEDGQEIRPSLINEDLLKHPDYLLIDLSVSYTFKEKYGISLIVNNLCDDNYMEKDAYYMPGRSFMTSLSFQF
jgi:vitamin B12 transporter